MTSILDDTTRLTATQSSKEQLHLATTAQGIQLEWIENNESKIEEQDRAMFSLGYVLVVSVGIAANCGLHYLFPQDINNHPLVFPSILLVAVVAVVVWHKKYKPTRLLRHYGANAQGVWIATAQSVEFYTFQDITHFEQERQGMDQYDIGIIRAFRAVPANNDQEETAPVIAFELTDIPNSYWRFTQLRAWQQQALLNSS